MWEIRQGDALERLREMPDCSVQTCITSPPYFGLRDYGTGGWVGGDPGCDHVKGEMRRGVSLAQSVASTRGGAKKIAEAADIPFGRVCGKCGAEREDEQLGLEATPDEYVVRLVEVFREVKRVLRDDGIVWLNLGDSYCADHAQSRNGPQRGLHAGIEGAERAREGRPPPLGCKPKDLLGIPWMVAFALRADGWWLRSDIIWNKPNPMPESVTDRPTRSHEYLFLLTKSSRYFYDGEAIREEGKDWSVGGPGTGIEATHHYGADNGGNEGLAGLAQRYKDGEVSPTRNKRSVWTVATQPFPGAHFATFPPKLIEPCVLAGAPPEACETCGAPWRRIVRVEGETARDKRTARGESASAQAHMGLPGGPQGLNYAGAHGDNMRERTTVGWEPSCGCDAPTSPAVVLDPFAGAGTTGVVALRRERSFIGIELNPAYAEMARQRIRDDGPLFNVAAEVA